MIYAEINNALMDMGRIDDEPPDLPTDVSAAGKILEILDKKGITGEKADQIVGYYLQQVGDTAYFKGLQAQGSEFGANMIFIALCAAEAAPAAAGAGIYGLNRLIRIFNRRPNVVATETQIGEELVIKEAQIVSKAGTLVIEKGGVFSASEIRAAEHMKNLGNDVKLRMPQGTRAGGETSDLLVNGVNYDVYTPTTGNVNQIISAIAEKNSQTAGVVLDLSHTSVTPEQLGNILARVAGMLKSWGKTCNISDIVIIGK